MTSPAAEPTPPLCVECGDRAELATGKVIYPHRAAFHGRWYWLCPCGAYVGCHGTSLNAAGRPGNGETRGWRQAAHRAFDPLWQRKAARDGVSLAKARTAGYRWLSSQLGRTGGVHIGEMTADEAKAVVEICRRVGSAPKEST